MEIKKCKKCDHYYRLMTGEKGAGYNPYPCCHRWEDEGKSPNLFTQECFTPKKKKLVR